MWKIVWVLDASVIYIYRLGYKFKFYSFYYQTSTQLSLFTTLQVKLWVYWRTRLQVQILFILLSNKFKLIYKVLD